MVASWSMSVCQGVHLAHNSSDIQLHFSKLLRTRHLPLLALSAVSE